MQFLGVTQDDRQRVVQLVRDARHHGSERTQLVVLVDRPCQRLAVLFGGGQATMRLLQQGRDQSEAQAQLNPHVQERVERQDVLRFPIFARCRSAGVDRPRDGEADQGPAHDANARTRGQLPRQVAKRDDRAPDHDRRLNDQEVVDVREGQWRGGREHDRRDPEAPKGARRLDSSNVERPSQEPHREGCLQAHVGRVADDDAGISIAPAVQARLVGGDHVPLVETHADDGQCGRQRQECPLEVAVRSDRPTLLAQSREAGHEDPSQERLHEQGGKAQQLHDVKDEHGGAVDGRCPGLVRAPSDLRCAA